MLRCPTCIRDLPMLTLQNPTDTCPFCGNALVPEHLLENPRQIDMLNTEEMKPFNFVDAQLYDRVRSVVPKASWHLAIIAEILDFEYKRLSDNLNDAPPISNCFFYISSTKARCARIKTQFDEFVHCLADIQEIFTRNLAVGAKFPGMIGLWDFYQELSTGIDRLSNFHRSVVGLTFVRDSPEHEIQVQMMDWVHYLLICFESLKKQLDRKSKLEPDQLQDRSVQVTLAPPGLYLFFARLDELQNRG